MFCADLDVTGAAAQAGRMSNTHNTKTWAALGVLVLSASACSMDMMADTGSATALNGAAPASIAQHDVAEEPVAAAPEESAGNPFVSAASDPLSTFASDVDTASYDLFRSVLQNEGRLLPVQSVRSEEFINSFQYDYPAPARDATHPFAIDIAASPDFLGTERTLLRVGVQALPLAEFEKKPANIAFLIDVSGSMQDELKLPLVKRLLIETLEVLNEDDRVAIVTYANGTGVALASSPASSKTIPSVIDDLTAGGSTAGASGLDLAYEQVQAHFIEGGINHVILCTDGDFNVGPSSTAELVRAIELKRQTGITFTAVGFGTQPNDQMLEAISNKGNGVYGIVGSQEQATTYAHERMLSSVQLVAKDLKIQVEFNPEHVYAYRLIGYEDRALTDEQFRDDAVDAGEVGAGHRVTALYDLALKQQDLPENATLTEGEGQGEQQVIAPSDLALVHVRYKHLDADVEDAAFETQQALAVSAIADPDLDLRWAGSVAAFAELLRGNPYVTGDMLDPIATNLAMVVAEKDDPAKREFIQLFEQARPMLGH